MGSPLAVRCPRSETRGRRRPSHRRAIMSKRKPFPTAADVTPSVRAGRAFAEAHSPEELARVKARFAARAAAFTRPDPAMAQALADFEAARQRYAREWEETTG